MSSTSLLSPSEAAAEERQGQFYALLHKAGPEGGPAKAFAFIQNHPLDEDKQDYSVLCKKTRGNVFNQILENVNDEGRAEKALEYITQNKFSGSDPTYETLVRKARSALARKHQKNSISITPQECDYRQLPDSPSIEAKQESLSEDVIYSYFAYRSLHLIFNKTAPPLLDYLEYLIVAIVPLLAAASASTMFNFSKTAIETPEERYGELTPETHWAFICLIGISATIIQALLSLNSNYYTETHLKRSLGIQNPHHIFKTRHDRKVKAFLILAPTCIPTSIFSVDTFPELAIYWMALLCIFRSSSAFVINFNFFNKHEMDKRLKTPRAIDLIHVLLAIKEKLRDYQDFRPDELMQKLGELNLLRNILTIRLHRSPEQAIHTYENILKQILQLITDIPKTERKIFLEEPEYSLRASIQHEICLIPLWFLSFFTKEYLQSLLSRNTLISIVAFYTALTINFRAATTIGKHIGLDYPDDIPSWFLGLFSSNPSLAFNCWFFGLYFGGCSLYSNWINYKSSGNSLVKTLDFLFSKKPLCEKIQLKELPEEKLSNQNDMTLMQDENADHLSPPSVDLITTDQDKVSRWRIRFHGNAIRVAITAYGASSYGVAQSGSSITYPFVKGDGYSKVSNLIFNFLSTTSLGFMSIDAAFARGREHYYRIKCHFLTHAIDAPYQFYTVTLQDPAEEDEEQSPQQSSLIAIPDLREPSPPATVPKKNLFDRMKNGTIEFFKNIKRLTKESFTITQENKRDAFVFYSTETVSHAIDGLLETLEDLRDPFVLKVIHKITATKDIQEALKRAVSNAQPQKNQTKPTKQFVQADIAPSNFGDGGYAMSKSKKPKQSSSRSLLSQNTTVSPTRSPKESKQASPHLLYGNNNNLVPDALDLSSASSQNSRRGSLNIP